MVKVTRSSMKGVGRGGGVGARSGVCDDERLRREWAGEARRLKGRRLTAALNQCRQVRRKKFDDEVIEVFRIL
jgi:hypothetical protein